MGRMHRSGKEFPPNITSHVKGKAVPKCVHRLIQEALAIRDNLGWSKEAVDSNEDLQSIEARIQSIAEYFIPDFLPPGWKYDPATARSLVVDKSLKPQTPIKRIRKPRKTVTSDRCCHAFPRLDKKGNPPKIYETSMKPIWDEFKKFDAKIPMLDYYYIIGEEQKTVIPCDHPFVKDISNFALDSFNEALDTRVKYKQGKLSALEIIDCHYYKLEPDYWFVMMIKANEDGKCGVYKVKVEVGIEDGLTTLSKFDFIRFDGEGSMEIDQDQDDDADYESDDYLYSGLVRRTVTKSEVARRGYDYRNQYRFERILTT